jgi:hypothetical protein
MKEIYSSCPSCSGTGIENITTLVGENEQHTQMTCHKCAGDGRVSNQYLSEDLITLFQDMNDKINDMNDKINDIFEKINE